MNDSESMDVEELGTENVVSVRVIQSSFKSIVSEAIDETIGAKLVINRYGLDGNTQETQEEKTSESMEPRLGDKLTILINKISIAIRRLGYALNRGTVYNYVWRRHLHLLLQARCESVCEQSSCK